MHTESAAMLGPLPPTWDTQMEFLAPNLGLALPQLLQTLVE